MKPLNKLEQLYFSGLNTNTNYFLMPKDELIKAQNVYAPKLGQIGKRNGYAIKNAQIVAGHDILSIYTYYLAAGTQKIIASCNTDLYVDSGSAWSAASQSLTADSKGRFATLIDYAFYVNGADATRSYNGTSWSTATNVTSAPIAKDIINFKDRLYLINCKISGTWYRSRIVFSSVPAGSPLAITWTPATDYIDVYPDDGDYLVGSAINSSRLVLFKKNNIYIATCGTDEAISSVERFSDIGSDSTESIKTYENKTFFFNRSGVYMIKSLSRPTRISDKIQDYIQGISQTALSDVNAVIDEVRGLYILSVGTITLSDETISNASLVYDIKRNNWYVFSFASAPQVWGTNVDASTGKKEVYFGDDAGKIYKFWSGNSDNTTAIVTKLRTKPLDNGYPELQKEYEEVYFYTKNGEGVKVQCVIDDSSEKQTVGELQQMFTKKILKIRGRLFAFELSDSGTTIPWVLEGFTVSKSKTYGTK